MIEIDNKKMLELILRNHPSEQDWINICDIKLALKDQGLVWNGKEIVSIESEQENNKPTVSWDENGILRFDNLTIEQTEKLKNALIGEPNGKDELTELDRAIQSMLQEWEEDVTIETMVDFRKRWIEQLLSIARKQIASELESKIGVYNTSFGYVEGIYSKEDMGKAQRRGYKDCIKAIKGE